MKNTFSLCFLTFVCFLVIGYSTSTFLFFTPGSADAPTIATAEEDTASIQSMKNGQRNILLVSVDSIKNEKPSLQGIWLLTYFPGDNHLNFLPIFPSGRSSLSDDETRLYESFATVSENGQLVLAQAFTDQLKQENYWWSSTLIADQDIQSNMLAFFTGTYRNNKVKSEDRITPPSPSALVDAPAAFAYQLSSIKTACRYLSSPNTDWSKLFFLLSSQFYSDFEPQLIISDLNSSNTSRATATCQFPTLQQQVKAADYTLMLPSVMK